MAISANHRDTMEKAIVARRSEDQRRKSRALYWREALTSLWAPITLFGILFLLGLMAIEFHTPNSVWVQPILKGFGLLMLVYFVGLWAHRLGFPKAQRLRQLRHEAHEHISEIQKLLAKHGSKLDPNIRERIVEQASATDGVRIAGDAQVLETELGKLSELAEKHLSAWRKNSVSDFSLGFIKALAIALLIRSVIIEPFKIPSGSMIPTLAIGDQIFVNKFIYGVRIPWVNKVPFIIVRPPERGDVIVFNNPMDESKDFIKRVIGIPGDKVEIINEVVHINGVPQPRELLDGSYTYMDQQGEWYPRSAAAYQETIDGHAFTTLREPHHPKGRITEGPFIVPERSVFVMGDNRDNSLDSRYGLGAPGKGDQVEYVPYGNIKGKAMIIWLSLSYDGFLSKFFGGTGLRTDRLFLPVR